ncbi:TPA: homoserine O-acetyltransferase [Candidatus Gastranaerophilales bacterium HUM_8]|nr:MAG TPA: homoserine O-acetyltransferase [Candidatus Gastranaerophilales bacterium HUM_8]
MLVETKLFKINELVHLESGKELPQVEIAYETYGKLNENGDNAILLLHALTGDAHAAGYHQGDKKPGWWDDMVGSGKAFDTDKYFVICSNMLGGCKGTTGPNSINPATGVEYGLSFPVITIEDVVKVQKKLTDFLGVKKLIVAGGSMGGMQALEWALSYGDMVSHVIVIASTPRLSAQSIAFNAVGRNAILSDPNFNNGNYYHAEKPEKGLAIARMVGHITYLCEEAMHEKFARRFQDKDSPNFNFDIDFEVESYLAHQGQTFVDRFDANSYLYITKAVDYFDIAKKYGSLEKAFKDTKSKYLVISFSSDWLFPSSQSKELVKALMENKKDVSYCEIQSPCGHDAFLLEYETQTRIIRSFLCTD